MSLAKKWGVFLVVLALLCAGAALLFWDTGAECLSILTTGRGNTAYVMTAADTEQNVYALGSRKGAYLLVEGDAGGQRKSVWTLPSDLSPLNSYPSALYVAAGGAVYLGLYHTGETQTYLQVYRLTDEGKSMELLFNEPCPGHSLPEQMAGKRLSAFSEVDSVTTFSVIEGDTARFYGRTGSGSLQQQGEETAAGLRAAAALADGSHLLATDGELNVAGRDSFALRDKTVLTQLEGAGTGIYYVDGAGLEVFYTDCSQWSLRSVLRLNKDAYDLDSCLNMTLTQNGEVLLLLNDGGFLRDNGSTTADLSAMLYRPVWQCVLILAALLLGVLLSTAVIWYIVCEQRKFHLPLLLRWGVLGAAIAALSLSAMLRWMVTPAGVRMSQRETVDFMTALTAAAVQNGELGQETLNSLESSFAGVESGAYQDAEISVYEKDAEGIWRLSLSNTAMTPGQQAVLTAGFHRAEAEQATTSGSASWTGTRDGRTHCVCYREQGSRLLAVDVETAAVNEASTAGVQQIAQALRALTALLTALLLLCLCCITAGMRRVLRGMERLSAGEKNVEVRLGSGDEVACLGDGVTNLGRMLEQMEHRQSEVAESYHRFVPEQILSLLGQTSILKVDKQTCAARNLATMMVWFSFPPQVYEKSGKELFNHVNEILERTAAIVAKNGGAVFNFAYNGYDAVFEESAAAVSTAVAIQQEILRINREHEVADRPQVAMHIALDRGNVTVGVVGDEKQIEPTSISSSFAAAKCLLDLCQRLQARILCTEAVIASAGDYGSRYVGKCREGGHTIRTYEIFDGDPFEIRKVKEQTNGRFSEGVYALYSRDFTQAKRIFLQLVHTNADDGGARYYLYLADKMEKRPEEEIQLNGE